MSDEQTPTPAALRLKPRLRPAESQPPATVPPMAPSVASGSAQPSGDDVSPISKASSESPGSEPSALKIRLKPKSETPPAAKIPAAVEPSAVVPPEPPTPPAPPLFAPSTQPAVVPPVFVPEDRPPHPAPVLFSDFPARAPSSDAGASADPGKFKLKPKLSPASAPVASVPPANAAVVPPAPVANTSVPATIPAATESEAVKPAVPPARAGAEPVKIKTPPPFPVVAPTRAGKTAPPMPIPHVRVKADVLEPQPEVPAEPPPKERRGLKLALGALVVVALAAGGFFGWNAFMNRKPVAKPAAADTASAAPQKDAQPTPSDTLNKIAHIPAQAINKAQQAVDARRASGQARVDAAADGVDLPAKSFGVPPAAPIKQGSGATAGKSAVMTSVAPGLTATTHVEAAPEASAAFRSFVANAKVSGVFQGSPARAMINGRLLRAGDSADSGLGVIFDGVDNERRQLVFKDRTGATVSRKY